MSKKIKENNIFSEKGSVTLFVLIAIIFFLIVSLNLYLSNKNKIIAQSKEIKAIEENYGKDLDNMDEIYETLINNDLRISFIKESSINKPNKVYYNLSEWTNENVIAKVTINTENNPDAQLQVKVINKKTGSSITYNKNQVDNNEVIITENSAVIVTLGDKEKKFELNKFDKEAPTGKSSVNMASASDTEVTITITAQDTLSGIKSITNTTTTNITKINDTTYKATDNGVYSFQISDKANNIINITAKVSDILWAKTTSTDDKWYSYNDVSNGDKKVNVNAPKLGGNMKPIKYVGPESDTQTGSKWANAMTSDGSMWVWLPRYAYKITEGYHTNVAGTIEVAFLDTNNRFLNGETGTLTTNVEDPEAGQTKWLVHPAFTSNAESGGGFGEIEGLWVGKFEATGTYSNGDASKVSVKPGESSLRSMTINEQYKAGLNATYGESANLNSHMAKNSEWGAIVYLTHSKYGTNKKKVEENMSEQYYTGSTNIVGEIYTTKKAQSTTHNATGVYDLNGGAWEKNASYVNNGNSNLKFQGGTTEGDLYGATEKEQMTSTKYKMVYSSMNNQEGDYMNLETKLKGDAIYETSLSHSNETGAWFNGYAVFPYDKSPFFNRGSINALSDGSIFAFYKDYGGPYSGMTSFRLILVI